MVVVDVIFFFFWHVDDLSTLLSTKIIHVCRINIYFVLIRMHTVHIHIGSTIHSSGSLTVFFVCLLVLFLFGYVIEYLLIHQPREPLHTYRKGVADSTNLFASFVAFFSLCV